MTLNERSQKSLAGVHPDLVRVVELAAQRCPVQIVVTEGLRSLARQKELVAAGKSWTINGRHLTGHAIDVVDGDNFGYDIPDLDKIASAMKAASIELQIPITWGGDWKSRDTPHFELCRTAYPASGVSATAQVVETAGKVVKARGVVAVAGAGVAVVADVARQATEAVGTLNAPLVPKVPSGIVDTMGNLSGWAKIWPVEQWRMLLVGAVAFAVVAVGSAIIQKVKS